MTRGELCKMLERDAKEFRLDRDHYRRNAHMHTITEAPPQEVVDAVLVGFINHVARNQCMDLALYTRDLVDSKTQK